MTQAEKCRGFSKGGRQAREQLREETARSIGALDRAIGARLRQIRSVAGIQRENLAQAIGITAARLYRYERGMNRLPAAHLPDVARALSVTIDHLVGDGSPQSHRAAQSGSEPLARFLGEVALIHDAADVALLLRLARRLARKS